MTIKCFCLFSLLYRFLFYINVCLYKIVTLKYIYSSYYNTGISFQFLKLKKKFTRSFSMYVLDKNEYLD